MTAKMHTKTTVTLL